MSKYAFLGTLTDEVAGTTVTLFHVGPVDATLTALPDAIASLEVGAGLDIAGTAVLQGTGSAETLDLTLTDNVPGLPSSLVDTISLKGAPLFVSIGVELLERLGTELTFSGTITKVAS